jgi:pathogenesis-related protein 1
MQFKPSIRQVGTPVALLVAILLFHAHGVSAAPVSKSGNSKGRTRSNPVSAVSDEARIELLRVHNAIRQQMSLPPLQWSAALASFSQRWANTMIRRNIAAHNPNSPYGENIFITGPGAMPTKVVREWAAESADYSYSTNACAGDDCGHYTQIVWRNSERVGCGVAHSHQREVWVCSYDPPGNYSNEWPY